MATGAMPNRGVLSQTLVSLVQIARRAGSSEGGVEGATEGKHAAERREVEAHLLQVDSYGRIAVQIFFTGDMLEGVERVRELGEVIHVSDRYAMVSAFIAPEKLTTVAKIFGVHAIVESPRPASGPIEIRSR